MDSFCDVFLKKRFMKCISKKTDTCYLFVGKIPYIKTITNKLKKNKKNNESDNFKNINDKEIDELFDYLNGSNKDLVVDYDTKKIFLEQHMFLDKYSSEKFVFVNESINEDDTNEIILKKIIYNCYSKNVITESFLYAWYNDGKQNTALCFDYDNSNISYDDFFEGVPNDYIDQSLVDGNGDSLPKQINNQKLVLCEKNKNPENVFYFCSLEEYLTEKNMFNEILKFSEEEIKVKKELKLFLNGLIFKYWPDISLSEILSYNLEESIMTRKLTYEKQKAINDIYNRGNYIIESEFLGSDVNDKIHCENYSLTIVRLQKLSSKKNTIHLSKLFKEYTLKNNVPFMKLLLDSHDDAFYKLYEKSLMYEGTDKTSQRHISKQKCKEWSDGYNIQTEYGYNYLHSGNVILFKIYEPEKDIYCSLVIHLNGDIECIIEHNDRELHDKELYYMIYNCNALLSELNMQQFYSFEPIDLLDDDFITNIHSATQVDFLNSGLLFSKDDFQDKKKRTFPNWDEFLGTFIQNFPMYFRTKTIEETENESQIIGRYNRVDNYANITTIQSAIASYKIIYEDPEIIIQKLSKDYNKDPDFIRKEYETWEELMSMKEGIQKTSKLINEGGSEIKIWLNQKEDLLIEIKNMKSFSEQRRIFVFIKTMLKLYYSYINDRKGTIQRRLFESIDEYTNEIYDDKDDDEEEIIEPILGVDELDDLLDDMIDDDEKDELDELLGDDDDSDDIDFDQLGGMNSEGYYETKSYYLKRLKEYDSELFKFKSKKKQKNGNAYGYPKYCGAVDDRHPIAVTDEELERINESEDVGSGRQSYSEAISVPRRPKNIKYICPKYWDISRSLSIRPDAVNPKDIIPKKLPKGSNGRTRKSVLERNAIYWLQEDVKYYIPDIKEESKQLHPMGYGLPCCFNASKILKGDPEKRKKKKEENVIGEGYISNKDPVGKDKYAHPSPSLMKYFNQTEKTFAKKKSAGFLRMGVTQNDNDFVFTTSSFLQSYFKILTTDKIDESMFIEIIKQKLITNIDKYQKCPLIHQKFRKDNYRVSEEDKEFIKMVLDKPETTNHFSKNTIERLKKEINENNLLSNETGYLYHLLLSMKNYIDFLKSDENRNDTYILPLLLHLDEINIVVFENIDDEIKIKVTDYTKSEKLGFIYKRGNFYEPILYRYYDYSEKEIKETFKLTLDLLKNNHYEIIMNDIYQKITSQKKQSKIDIYEKIIEGKGDKVTKLYIDNYSNVTYLITRQNKIIPIEPEPIPLYKNYHYIYSFLNIDEIEIGMKVKVVGKNKKIAGTVSRLPFGKIGDEKISIKGDDGKNYPVIKCNIVCFLEDKLCSQLLPTYDTAVKYLSDFKQHFQIQYLIENEEGEVNCIYLTNDTYLPVISEKINSKYEKIQGINMLNAEKQLYQLKNIDDERKLFMNTENYEEYITKLAIQHILNKIEETNITVKGLVKESQYYKIGEKIHFMLTSEIKDEEKINTIKKIDKKEHYYSQFENEYTMDGIVKTLNDENEEGFSFITLEISLIDQVNFVLSDPIMINAHKKLRLYEIMDEHIDELFYLLKDKDFPKYELDRYVTLCNEKNEVCNYPCKKDERTCKLYIKEKDRNGNLLVEKIKWKFIEKMIIFGTKQKDKIIEEKISVNDLIRSTKFDELFYSFSEFKANILEDIFIKKSKYIQTSKENKLVKKRNTFLKKLSSIPYSIQKLFGKKASVVFNLNNVNSDFLALEYALNECGISYDIKSLKDFLMDEITSHGNKAELLKSYFKDYSNIKQLTDDVKDDSYRIQIPDLKLLAENFSDKEIDIGFLLISSQGNIQKKNNVYFNSTNIDIMHIETVPIIPFYHTYHKDEYILSNILINDGEELNYTTTVSELYDINSIHKKWINI